MSRTVSDSEKERLHRQYGEMAHDDPILSYKSVPKRDDPLTAERDNLVYVTTVGGPIYDIQRGRIMETGLSREDVVDSRGITTHSGTVAQAEYDEYVNVRYGTATMHTCYVPIEYVLEIVAEDCEWSSEKGQHISA